MPINLWDKEFNRQYKEILRDYLDEGYDLAEAKTLLDKTLKRL